MDATQKPIDQREADLNMSLDETITLGKLKALIATIEENHPLSGLKDLDELPVIIARTNQDAADGETNGIRSGESLNHYGREFIVLYTDQD